MDENEPDGEERELVFRLTNKGWIRAICFPLYEMMPDAELNPEQQRRFMGAIMTLRDIKHEIDEVRR